MNHRCRTQGATMFALLAIALFIAGAADAAPIGLKTPARDLVRRTVDAAERVALAAEPMAWASAANDRGGVPASLSLERLTVSLKRTPERQEAFETLLREQQDPASPNYHRWLTPSEIGERFGASQHDIDAVAAWLAAAGLAVDRVSNSRTRIRFSGTSAAVASAFATELRYYAVDGAKRIANSATPTIPSALAGIVGAVEGLHTVRFRPAHHMRPATRSLVSPSPAGTNCASGTCEHVMFPADFAKVYDLGPVHARGIDGAGQTIAIVGRARVSNADVTNFQDLAELAHKTPQVTIPPAGTDPGPAATTCSDTGTPSCSDPSDLVLDQGEATLDVQRAGSIAPGATVNLIASGNVGTSDGVSIGIDYVIDTDPVPAKILSISFTSCEADNGRSVVEAIDGYFAQAAAEGISVFVASGDAGVAGCASLDQAPAPGEAVTTNALCSSGHVTCVGGTEFADQDNGDAYWSRSNGAGFLSALGYIPEGAWNEPLGDAGATQLAATGGGVSAYIAKPSWQAGAGVPGSAGRYTPDVSFNASTREGYFTCMAAQNGPCTVSAGSFSFLISGGTSASAPDMAAVAALLNQDNGAAQGNLNPKLYALAANPANGVYHDVTVASSGVASCTALPSPCNNSTPGPSGLSGGLDGYRVGTGYDEATGLGSVDIANLVDHWTDAPAAGINMNQFGLTGPWYEPATDGQGLVLQVAPDLYRAGDGLLFGGWFTYDTSASGGKRWYTVQGEVNMANASAEMPIYVSEGGNFDAPPTVGADPVGTATLAFSDCQHGTLSYAFTDGSGRNGTIALTRIGQSSTCTADGDDAGGAGSTGVLLSGAWYEPSTSGQGLVIDVNPLDGTLFAAWYTYAANGAATGGGASQRWYTLQSLYEAGSDSLEDVGIYESSGGVFDDPAPVTTTRVGSARLEFHDCETATLTYSFTGGAMSGRNGTIDLERALPTLAGCDL